MTIETASFNKLSPKMIVYSFGSTLYCVNMLKIVTGSVALSVVPKIKHSSNDKSSPSSPKKLHTYTSTLSYDGQRPFHPPNTNEGKRRTRCQLR